MAVTEYSSVIYRGLSTDSKPTPAEGAHFEETDTNDLYVYRNGAWSLVGGSGVTTRVQKTADEIVNGSTTLQNDDHLLFAVGANEVWLFVVYLLITSTASANFKGTFVGPTGSSGSHAFYQSTSSPPNEIALGTAFADNTAGTVKDLSTRWGFIVNGGTAGNLQLQWAQNTGEASDTKVHQGSILLAWQVV